jgi:hypothetical protein
MPEGKPKTVLQLSKVGLVACFVVSIVLTLFIQVYLGRKFLLKDSKAIKKRNRDL